MNVMLSNGGLTADREIVHINPLYEDDSANEVMTKQTDGIVR